ncbi:hypothetical protein [Calothrix rhizosoleniae]|uniref:hypothetical protein n=2 Tax=Calothrix rhizosoleniae TaxID=888997 RepID=UPI000B49A590
MRASSQKTFNSINLIIDPTAQPFMLKLKPLYIRKFHLNDFQNLVIQIAILVSILCSLLVLIGWYLDLEIIKNIGGLNKILIKANTELYLILSGLALHLLQPKIVSRRNKSKTNWKLLPLWEFLFGFHQWLHFHAHILAKVALGLLILIPSLTMSEYIGNWHLGIDELLFSDASPGLSTSYLGRMSFFTAVNFMIIGMGMIEASASSRRGEGTVPVKKFHHQILKRVISPTPSFSSFFLVIATTKWR